jgi:hypothetical protein
MSLITAHRDAPDRDLVIDSLGTGSKVDIQEACQRIGELEKMTGGMAMTITITRDTWPRCEEVTGTLASALKGVYETSDAHRDLLPSARLQIRLYAIGQPFVEPEDRHCPAALENRLALACQGWWNANREALCCINSAKFLIDYSEVRQAHDRRVMRALLSEKLAVACGRAFAALGETTSPELEKIRQLLSEYDAL